MNWTTTRWSSHVGYVVQAIVNNLAPLLFVIVHRQFDIDVAQLGLLASLNFGVQLLVDIVAAVIVDRVGYRIPMVAAHLFAGAGLILLAVLPNVLPSPYLGLCLAVIVYAIGGGLLEVIVSPIVEHIPVSTRSKAAGMAMLHSFYCWGQLTVVLGTTAALTVVGDRWPTLPVVWSVIPFINAAILVKTPMPETIAAEDRTPLGRLGRNHVFLLALALMATGGAAELTMSQWSSFFAQQATGMSKQIGDLMGPGLFALLMGLGRTWNATLGARFELRTVLAWSGIGAAACYVVCTTASVPAVSLLGCAGCGLFVAVMWPGATSLTAARFPAGGAAMFAILALAGDAGATLGPSLAGFVADAASGPLAPLGALLPDDGGTGLRIGLLMSAAVPVAFSCGVLVMGREEPPKKSS